MTKHLPKEKKAEILRLYQEGVKVAAISSEFGVSGSYPTILASRYGIPLRLSLERRQGMGKAARERGARLS